MIFSRSHRVQRLLVKHVQKESSQEEEAEIRAGLAVSKEEGILLEQLQHTWDLLEPAEQDVDLDAAWTRWLEVRRQQAKVTHLARPTSGLLSTRRSRMSRSVPYFFRVAAVVAGALILSLPVFNFVNQPAPIEPETEVFATGKGQRTTVQLSDGSQVILNAESSIMVSKDFGEKDRDVVLEGEAFFEVKSGSEHAFAVYVEDALIQVHGTSFNVRAYASEMTEVFVSEGIVSLQPSLASLDTVMLRANHSATILDGNRKVWRHHFDQERYIAWVNGGMVFREAPFSEVRRELERRYNLEIQLTDAARNVVPLDATFRGEPLGEVLNMIAGALDLDYTWERSRIVFFPKGDQFLNP